MTYITLAMYLEIQRCSDGTYSVVARKAGRGFHGIVCSTHVLSDLWRVLVSSLIEEDAMHLNTLAAVCPAGIGRDVLKNIAQVSVTIVGPHVAHGTCVRVRIELLDGWEIIRIRQKIIARSAFWIDDDGVVEIRRCVESMEISSCL